MDAWTFPRTSPLSWIHQAPPPVSGPSETTSCRGLKSSNSLFNLHILSFSYILLNVLFLTEIHADVPPWITMYMWGLQETEGSKGTICFSLRLESSWYSNLHRKVVLMICFVGKMYNQNMQVMHNELFIDKHSLCTSRTAVWAITHTHSLSRIRLVPWNHVWMSVYFTVHDQSATFKAAWVWRSNLQQLAKWVWNKEGKKENSEGDGWVSNTNYSCTSNPFSCVTPVIMYA